MQALQTKGKLFYQLADEFCGNTEWEKDDDGAQEHIIETEKTFLKGHKQAITCCEWLADNKSLITGSKDCSLIQWDLESQKKLFFRGEKFSKKHEGHFDEVLCCAVSPNGKYLVSGGKDRVIRVWDIHNQKQI